MRDQRIDRLAEVLLQHSCQLQAGERVLIEAFDLENPELLCRLVEQAQALGATAVVSSKNNSVLRSLYRTASREALEFIGQHEARLMETVQAYVGIRGSRNSDEFADVSGSQMSLVQDCIWKPVHIDIRVPKTKWVVLRYPTASFAQLLK